MRVVIDTTALFAGAPQSYMYFSATLNEGKYYPVDSLARTVSFQDGSGATLASASVSFRKDAYYTVYFHGHAPDYRVLVTTDTVEAPDRNAPYPSYIRLVNLVPDGPPLSLRFGSPTAPPAISNVAYGNASQYESTRAIDPQTSPLFATDANGKILLELQKGFVFIPAGVRFTIVISGQARPAGSERFLMSAIFNESVIDEKDSLYGVPPLRFSFGAIRMVSLTPGDSMLDATFYDPSPEFAANDFYRRTLYGGWPGTLDYIHTLGNKELPYTGRDNSFGEYLPLAFNVGKNMTFRIEYHQPWQPGQPGGANPFDYRRQDVFAPDASFLFEESRRYTIVAYGPYANPATPAPGRSQILVDNTPVPPAGMASVRLFHGGFGSPAEAESLRLRIGGITAQSPSTYGSIPPAGASIPASPGAVDVDVLNEQGNLVYSQTLSNTPLEAGKSYTIFLSRGVDGVSLYLYAISEEYAVPNG